MSLVAETGEDGSSRLQTNLCKLADVQRVYNVRSEQCFLREMAVIKLAATREERAEIMQIASAFELA